MGLQNDETSMLREESRFPRYKQCEVVQPRLRHTRSKLVLYMAKFGKRSLTRAVRYHEGQVNS